MIDDDFLALAAEMKRLSRAHRALGTIVLLANGFLLAQLLLREDKLLPLAGLNLLLFAQWWTGRQMEAKSRDAAAKFCRLLEEECRRTGG